jgi:hypothetical protein
MFSPHAEGRGPAGGPRVQLPQSRGPVLCGTAPETGGFAWAVLRHLDESNALRLRLGVTQTAAWKIKRTKKQVITERDATNGLTERVELDGAAIAPEGKPIRIEQARADNFWNHINSISATRRLDPNGDSARFEHRRRNLCVNHVSSLRPSLPSFHEITAIQKHRVRRLRRYPP